MRLEKLDLNLFVVFDAIYRERSVTKVATHLNLTQPAVSNALSRLRATFDDSLFVRTPEGMMPTPVADAIVVDVKKALSLLGRSTEVNARFDPKISDKVFRFGMNDLAESLLLPVIQEKLSELAPNVAITSYYRERDVASEELKAGVIDLLLDVPAVNAKSLGQANLATLPYVVAMRKGHPLAKSKKMIIEDYLTAQHLHVSSRRKGRGQIDIALHRLGKKRKIQMRVQNYLVASRIAAQTDLLWTVPKVLVESLPLEYFELPFSVEPLEWRLYWSDKAENDPANQWIRKIFKEAVTVVMRGNT